MDRVTTVMNKLAARFQPQAAEDLDKVFQIRIEDGSPWMIVISHGQCEVLEGEHPDPDVTLIMDSATFIGIIDEGQSGTMAFLSGALRAEGDVMLATRLSSLFRR